MSLQAFLRLLLPREDHFYGILERHIGILDQAARELAKLKTGGQAAASLRESIQDLEHQGDRAFHDMLEALERTFVTPIDREDLQKLSKRIDDVIDLINATIRACVLFGVEQPTKPMILQIDKLVECTGVLAKAVPKLRQHSYPEIIRDCSQIHFFEKDGDVVFRDALSALFHDPAIDSKTILREKEVLEDLEKAINRCDQAAELLTNVAVKNS
jgi:uncharacterized protein Yka (UPF0111/DUF47 family)